MRQPLHLAIVALVALKSTTCAESDASKEMKQKWFMENPDLAFDNEADTFTLSFTHGAGDGPADPSPPIIEIFRRCPHGRRAPFPESMEYFGSAQDDDIDFLTTIASPANPDYFVPVRGDELYRSTWTFQINANVKDDHYRQGQHAVFALLNEGTDMAAIRVHFCIRVGLQNAKHISLDGHPPPVMNFREIYLTMSARLIAGFSHTLQVDLLPSPTDPPPVLRSQFDTQFQTRVIDVMGGGVQGTFHAEGFLCPGWDAHTPIPAGTMACLEICPIALDSAFVYTTSIPYMELGSIYGSPEVLLVEGGPSGLAQHSSYECTPEDGCCTIRFIATGKPRWVQGLGAVTMDRWDYEQDNLDDQGTQQLGVVAGNSTTHNETWPQRAVFRTEIFQIGPEEESSDTVSLVAIIVAVVCFGVLAAGGVYYSYIHHQLCCCVPVVAVAAKKTSDSDDDSNPPSPNASRHSVVLTDEDTSSENSRHSIGVSSPC